MRLNDVLSKAGKYKTRKRVGRGTGSGHGKTSSRGTKGFYSRSGAATRIGYEGGQTPIVARIPKRGFSNFNFAKNFQVVNVADLEKKFEAGARVDAAALEKLDLIPDASKPVKILGTGELTKKLTVAASRFSASASAKITAAGGTIEQV